MKKWILKKVTKKFMYKIFFNIYINKYFINSIEKTLEKYTKNKVLINFHFYFKRIKTIFNIDYKERVQHFHFNLYTPILSSKIIAEFIAYKMDLYKSARGITHYIEIIRSWHLYSYKYRKLFELYYKKKTTFNSIINYYGLKKYPLLGLRIECSGTGKKGIRKNKWFYGNFIKYYYNLSGKASTNTFSGDLDYYQLECSTYASIIGIKVWSYYKTHLINTNGRLISILLIE